MPSLGQNLFGSNAADIDSAETREWLDALKAVIQVHGKERGHFLIEQLLEGRKIPFRKVGKHRRIRVRDLLAYQERDQAEKRALVREITELAQEMGLEY